MAFKTQLIKENRDVCLEGPMRLVAVDDVHTKALACGGVAEGLVFHRDALRGLSKLLNRELVCAGAILKERP